MNTFESALSGTCNVSNVKKLTLTILITLLTACLSELSPALRNLLGTFDISLPWNRVFEADLSVSGGCHV